MVAETGYVFCNFKNFPRDTKHLHLMGGPYWILHEALCNIKPRRLFGGKGCCKKTNFQIFLYAMHPILPA